MVLAFGITCLQVCLVLPNCAELFVCTGLHWLVHLKNVLLPSVRVISRLFSSQMLVWNNIKFCCLFVVSAVEVIEIWMHLAANQNCLFQWLTITLPEHDWRDHKLSQTLSFTIVGLKFQGVPCWSWCTENFENSANTLCTGHDWCNVLLYMPEVTFFH